jgi:hypothetical protein
MQGVPIRHLRSQSSLVPDREAKIESGSRAVEEPDAGLSAWLISVLGSGASGPHCGRARH